MSAWELADLILVLHSAYEYHSGLYVSCMKHNDRDGEVYHRGRVDSLAQVLDCLSSYLDVTET